MMAVSKPWVISILVVLCYLSVAAQLDLASGELFSKVAGRDEDEDEDDHDEKKCPDKCIIGAGAWKKAAVGCKMKGGAAKKCGHDGHHDKCAVMPCKKWNKKGFKCSCKHEEEEEDNCPYKCFTTGKKWQLAQASCKKNGKKLTCDHDDHKDACKVRKCKAGGKFGFWCACAGH